VLAVTVITRACFSEQIIANCRSGTAGDDEELTSIEDVGDIPDLRFVEDDCPAVQLNYQSLE